MAPLAAGESLAGGAEGKQVEELQRRLAHLGYYKGNVDGSYGTTTETAVRDYQKATGHPDDGTTGTTGTTTWEQLERDAQGAGYGGAAEKSGAELEVGHLSDDGNWQWNGSDWVAAAGGGNAGRNTTASKSGGLATGQLSEDGHWQWDGTNWVAAPSSTATPHSSGGGQLSEDGHWQWDGTKWVAATGQGPAGNGGGKPKPVETEPAAPKPAAGETTPPAGAGEPKRWQREINNNVDDPDTEAAHAPSLAGTREGDGRG